MKNRLHTYQWDDEPKEERPSAFASTGFSHSSGYQSGIATAPPGRRTAPRVGLKAALFFVAMLLALGGWVICRLAPALR